MSFQIGDHGSDLRPFQEWLNRKFASYAGIRVDEYYGLDEARVVAEAMRRYGMEPSVLDIVIGTQSVTVEGAIATDAFLQKAGYHPPNLRPVVFSVEGHLSDMNIGPAVAIAQTLEAEGRCWSQPTGYDRWRLPFNNESGITELHRLFSLHILDNGRPFPPGTPWQLHIFSQGGIIGSEFMMRHVFPEDGDLHWRLADWRGTVAFGNPYRERDVIADWVPDPPSPGTQGLSNRRLVNTPTDMWKEHSRHGDLYAENQTDDRGEDKTAIYMAVQGQWTGDADSLLSQLFEIARRPLPEFIAMFWAILDGIRFVANMGPHGTYDLRPPIDWARQKLLM